MNENEWKLSKENAQLKKVLAQMQFNEAARQEAELGEKWIDPSAKPEKLAAVN